MRTIDRTFLAVALGVTWLTAPALAAAQAPPGVATIVLDRAPSPAVGAQHAWSPEGPRLAGLVLLGNAFDTAGVVTAVPLHEARKQRFSPLFAAWLDFKHRALDASDGSAKRPWYLIGDETLAIAPVVGGGVTGLRAVGKF